MIKPSSSFFKNIILYALCIMAVATTHSCVKGKKNQNGSPDTRISIEAIDLSGDDRLNSNISLSWFGTDPDGYVTGYEISENNIDWIYTASQDSTFVFSIPQGSDTADIDFYVRAIDNEGLKDETPAYLKIPLKNTPPVASFNDDRGPADTALAVATFFWNATDADGDNTVQKVEVKFNNGEWYEISRGQQLISFVIDTSVVSGPATGQLYYGTGDDAESLPVDGILANAENRLYIRATDIGGAVSLPDTSDAFYLKNKTPGARTLWVSGHASNITAEYRQILDNIGLSYDLLNFGEDISGASLPVFWDPTFKLVARLYDIMFVNADGKTTYQNPVLGKNTTLLNYMAPVLQSFTTAGGKSFITTKFDKTSDISELIGPLPIESLVTSPQGQARILPPDSGLVPLDPNPDYPKLVPQTFQINLVPIVTSSDASDFYRGQLTRAAGWQGTDVMAAARKPGNQLQQVFFAVELHNYNNDPASLEQLFEEILIHEF